jgi:hypothetical protein
MTISPIPAPPPSVQREATTDRSDTRLDGRWLALARVGWIALTLALLGLDVLGTPVAFHVAQLACAGNDCFVQQLTPAQMRVVTASGLSSGFYALYEVALYWIGILVYVGIAAAIFWRRSDEHMALFGAFTLVAFGAGPVFGLLNVLPSSNPAWSQPVKLVTLLGTTVFYVFFCLFPSGRFVPRWIRWAALVQVAGAFVTLIPYGPFQNLPFTILYGLLVFAQAFRYRRASTPLQRQQTKWVVLGFVVGLGGFLALLAFGNIVLSDDSRASALGVLFFNAGLAVLLLIIPISIGIAVQRSRLWDIDVLINRALVYGSLTTVLAAIYVACVLGAQALVQALTGEQSLPTLVIVGSTLLTAALFTPLRRRLQTGIDRRFYRRKYDAAKTLETFAATLRQEVDLYGLRDHVTAVVAETMQPAHISLWLRTEPHSPGGTR